MSAALNSLVNIFIIMPNLRIAVIDRTKCRPDKCDKPCIRFCPRVRTGDETVFEKEGKVYIAEELCVGCGICTKKCPKDAITIINLERELPEPIHQYGKNAFRLYGLPIPQKGNVVGLLGANGIGKTTALHILSGSLVPNLGDFKNGATWEQIIARFKGNELMNYLKDLRDKKIRAVYKPQQVDKIPQALKGKAGALIKDERGVFKKLAADLEIDTILDRDVAKLSGGELQRLAIAAALCRDADFYYFDEPSSFLDIRHRLIVARAIGELAENEKKAVLVVEHDLATLDYLADIIHIVYGQAGAYGVISPAYVSLRGINTFLDGYIREENIRFRDEPLSFKGGEKIYSAKYAMLQYPDFKKKFTGFGLDVAAGSFKAGEIVGVLGANALGKTTFAKILAGEITPDNVDFGTPTKIAYKPQYLKSDFPGTVSELLRKSVKKFGSQEFKIEVIRPLGIDRLLENNVQNLSGGELQRVAIAICLGQDVEFYLLDEPSAYLDAEERIKFAKTMRRFIETNQKACMLIDHDMLLLHYVSDAAIVFSGTPSKQGNAGAPVGLKGGMNAFLKEMDVTFRRDDETGRPRANKHGSQKDMKQKEDGVYYA